MHGTYIGNNRMVVTPVFGGRLVVPSTDLSLSLELVTTGVTELPLSRYLARHLQPGQTVFDIGANLGYYTVLMGLLVGPGGNVVAYEANPEMYRFLKDNIAINGLLKQVKAFDKAVYSSEQKELTFFVTERHPCNASLYHRAEGYCEDYQDTEREVKVPAEPLDKWADVFSRVHLIKMDIEGGEYHAFLGMREMFRRNMIQEIVFELNRQMLKENWIPFFELLRSLGREHRFSFFLLDGNGEPTPTDLDYLYTRTEVSVPAVLMKR